MTKIHLLSTGSSVLAGTLHATIIASNHAFLPFGYPYFFLMGITQILWAGIFFVKPSLKISYLGFVINGGVTVIWALAHYLPAPFSTTPEHFSALGISVATLQVLSIISAYFETARHHSTKENINLSHALHIPIKLFVMTFVGVIGYVSAKAMEHVFPDVDTSAGHSHHSSKENHKEKEGNRHESNENTSHEMDSHHQEPEKHKEDHSPTHEESQHTPIKHHTEESLSHNH